MPNVPNIGGGLGVIHPADTSILAIILAVVWLLAVAGYLAHAARGDQ